MKTKVLILTICCIFLYSCNSKCDGYAPDDIQISWSDYNTVRTVDNYFAYPKTAALHKNDTVRVCGYILGKDDADYYISLYENPDRFLTDDSVEVSFVSVMITDDPDDRLDGRAHSGRLYIPLHVSLEQMEWLKDYEAGEKIFVKGFCAATDPISDKGCTWIVKMQAISFSTEKE